MQVRVRLLGVFRDFGPESRATSPTVLRFVDATVTAGAVRARLGIPVDYPRIVFLDGTPVEDEHVLEDGDELVFVSPIAGG